MESADVQAIVDREIGAIQKVLGLDRWRIEREYVATPPVGMPVANMPGKAHVSIMDHSERAKIIFFPAAIQDEAELHVILRHELLHVVLSPHDTFQNLMINALSDNPAALKMARSAAHHASERTVLNLERMYAVLAEKDAPRPTLPG